MPLSPASKESPCLCTIFFDKKRKRCDNKLINKNTAQSSKDPECLRKLSMLPPPASNLLYRHRPVSNRTTSWTSACAEVTRAAGFSLVELSIVLVILGLLAGGVLTGQSLIRAAELRGVTTEFSKYTAAVNTFRDKYFAMPGDMSNAQTFWGVQHATPATCKTTASSSALTCNGDGNGMIQWIAAGSNESFRAWQHLANAGLIEGSYSGVKNSGSTDERSSQHGVNVPKSRLENAGFMFATYGDMSADPNWFDGTYINIFVVGKEAPSLEPWGGFTKPEEAWNIDTKLDDGKPAYGKVRTTNPNWPYTANCTTSIVESAAEYKLTDTSKACSLIIMNN